MKIKQKIKMARKAARLTQGELAKRAGVRQATLSDFERGKHALNSTLLNKLCKILNLTIMNAYTFHIKTGNGVNEMHCLTPVKDQYIDINEALKDFRIEIDAIKSSYPEADEFMKQSSLIRCELVKFNKEAEDIEPFQKSDFDFVEEWLVEDFRDRNLELTEGWLQSEDYCWTD